MASETTFSASLQNSKNGLSINVSGSKTVDMSDIEALATTQNIGTSTEALAYGDVNSPGYFFVKNLDATNFVRIGLVTAVTSGNAFITLLPGEFAFFPSRQTVIYAIADTAACALMVAIVPL